MRDIDPDDIDCLIAFTAMVTRVSVVIPDLKIAFFRCERCRQEEEVEVDRERVAHPKVCKNNACKVEFLSGCLNKFLLLCDFIELS